MEFRLLRYFLAVAREGTVSKAAETLFLTQPTLSRQLSDLEYELGTQLFIRGKKRIELTEAGMILKQRAEEILELQEKTVGEIQNRGKNGRNSPSSDSEFPKKVSGGALRDSVRRCVVC